MKRQKWGEISQKLVPIKKRLVLKGSNFLYINPKLATDDELINFKAFFGVQNVGSGGREVD